MNSLSISNYVKTEKNPPNHSVTKTENPVGLKIRKTRKTMSNQIDLETCPNGDSGELTTDPESQVCCHEHCVIMTVLYLTAIVAPALICFRMIYDLVLG